MSIDSILSEMLNAKVVYSQDYYPFVLMGSKSDFGVNYGIASYNQDMGRKLSDDADSIAAFKASVLAPEWHQEGAIRLRLRTMDAGFCDAALKAIDAYKAQS